LTLFDSIMVQQQGRQQRGSRAGRRVGSSAGRRAGPPFVLFLSHFIFQSILAAKGCH